MNTNIASAARCQTRHEWPHDRYQLEEALNNWREVVLHWLRDEITKRNERRQAAEDGLAIAHRNPGTVAEDVIQTLWDQYESTSVLVHRLAHTSDAIQAMPLEKLVILFQRTQKVTGYPWEGDSWNLPSELF
jgi:hypothetical protein